MDEPCPKCGHPHGPPFDFCRFPTNDQIPFDSLTGSYIACGCTGVSSDYTSNVTIDSVLDDASTTLVVEVGSTAHGTEED